jgi:DNA polymerase beta
MDHKATIVEALLKLQNKETADKQVWKARAYAKAIKEINTLDAILTIENVDNVKGIGKKIKDKIQEIIDTGKLHQAEEASANPKYAAITDLIRVHAIGPAKAKELTEDHNITSIDDLRRHPELLNSKQLMGLKYLDDFELRIPRKEMEKHEKYLTSAILAISPTLKVQIVGSYRRGAEDSGDIDVLITSESNDVLNEDDLLKTIVKKLEEAKYCFDTFALGNKKYLGVCKVKYARHFRRLDLLITQKHEFPFAQLYFTGSQAFNIQMRNVALSKGYSLSEYGFKDSKGKLIETVFDTEESVFTFLGLNFVGPKERTANALRQ